MSEMNRWGLGILLMLLSFEIGAGSDMGGVALFLYGIVATVGFVLFTHEKSIEEESKNEDY